MTLETGASLQRCMPASLVTLIYLLIFCDTKRYSTVTQKSTKHRSKMTNGSLMKVESIYLGAFCNTFALH